MSIEEFSLPTLLLALAAALAGCAAAPAPAADGAERQVREVRDAPTGSNLPRRDRASTGAVEVDKDSIEDSLRGATRNSGK